MTTLFVLVLFVLMGYGLSSSKVSGDLAALLGLGGLMLLGVLSPTEAFSGMSSPSVITIASTFIVTGALRRTGVTELIGQLLHWLGGTSEVKNIFVVVMVSAAVSALMNNLAATVLLLPSVSTLSTLSGVAPSRLFLPLSFGTLLGGMVTLVGTTPNVLASDMLVRQGEEPFRFFEFAPFGVPFVLVGALYLAFVGRHLLPRRGISEEQKRKRELQKAYRLSDRIFSLRVRSNSSLDGRSLESLQFGRMLGAQVISIIRNEEELLSPGAKDIIKSGDLLVVRGRAFEIEALLRLRGVVIDELRPEHEIALQSSLRGGIIELGAIRSGGISLEELDLKNKYKAIAIGIEHQGEVIVANLGEYRLVSGDKVFVVGNETSFELLHTSTMWSINKDASLIPDSCRQRLFSLRVTKDAPLLGLSLRDSHLGHLAKILIVGIIQKGGDVVLGLGNTTVMDDDILIVEGDRDEVANLIKLSELSLEAKAVEPSLESAGIGLVEVVLSPRSRLIGKTLEQIRFSDKYGFQVIALWRDGTPIRARLARRVLQFGDALLLQGQRDRIGLIRSDKDFIVLAGGPVEVRSSKAPIAVLALLLMIGLSVLQLLPLHIATFTAALVALGLGAVSTDEAYRDIEWRVVATVGALIPFAVALQRAGIVELISDGLGGIGGLLGTYLTLLLLALLAIGVSLLVETTLAIVMLMPVALDLALKLNYPTHGVAMVITLASSFVFMGSGSHRANVLVMSPGGYRPRDFLIVGGHLTAILLFLLLLLIQIKYHF